MSQSEDQASWSDKVLAVYAGSAVSRAVVVSALSLVPLVATAVAGPQGALVGAGASSGLWGLDAWLVAVYGKRSAERVTRLLDAVDANVARVGRATLDPDVLKSEEFADLSVQAVEATRRTRDDEKIRMYAGLLVGAASVGRPSGIEPESALAALAELSYDEVRILAHLQEHQLLGVDRQFVDLPEELTTDLTFHLNRIERTGFIQQVIITGGLGGQAAWPYRTTPTFERVRDMLRAGGYPEAT